jgi:PAS domain S-box-containing protein
VIVARTTRANPQASKPRSKKAPRSPAAFDKLLVDISTRFIHLPADRVDSEIMLAQRQVCECLGLDISSLWQMPPDNPATIVSTHIYVPPDYTVPLLEMDAQDFFPWSMVLLARGETVVLSRITDIPPEGASDLEIFRYYQIQSSICFPLSAGGRPMFGAVAFDTYRKPVTWSPWLITKLGLVAQIFANALARKRTDQALRESEARYRSIFETSIEGLYRTSPEGRILLANPALAKILGYDSVEALIRTVSDVGRLVWTDPEARDRFLLGLKQQGIISGYECQLSRQDGTTIWVSLSSRPVRGPDGRVAHYEGSIEDISERKLTEAALAESENRYRTLFETAPTGIILVSPDGYVLAANSLQARLFGYESQRQLEGFYAPLFIVEKDRERAARDMMAIAEGNGLTGRTYTAVRRDGSEFAAEVTGAVIRGPSHEVRAYLFLTRDVTKERRDENERGQLRQELAHFARIMTMAELSTSLAHEINQPLGAILNNAEAARSLLSRTKEERQEFGEILEDIIQDAQRAGDVVRRIRGLVKKSEAKFTPLSVNALIEDVVKLVHNSLSLNNVTLELDLRPDLPNIRGDRIRLQQVLLNLITNAIDAMKQGPSRRLQVRSTASTTDTIAVSISDSGTGFFKVGKDNVFKPFYTTKEDGLGMGLAICLSIIEEHEGRIWGEDKPTGGATFSFSLKTWGDKST